MIRLAVPADKNRCIELLQDSRVGAGFDKSGGFSFPFDPAYAARLFVFHATRDNACCFIHDVDGAAQGVLMAIATEHPFGPVKVARETVWWIDPAYRGSAAPRMLDAYEKWAAERRCGFTGMAGMGDDPSVGALYLRRGYHVAETHYLKPLSAA